jgi:hypothetical protein
MRFCSSGIFLISFPIISREHWLYQNVLSKDVASVKKHQPRGALGIRVGPESHLGAVKRTVAENVICSGGGPHSSVAVRRGRVELKRTCSIFVTKMSFAHSMCCKELYSLSCKCSVSACRIREPRTLRYELLRRPSFCPSTIAPELPLSVA